MTAPQSCTKGVLFNFPQELGLFEIILEKTKPRAQVKHGLIGFFISSSGIYQGKAKTGYKITLKCRKNNDLFENGSAAWYNAEN
jgi:hypothetical protein